MNRTTRFTHGPALALTGGLLLLFAGLSVFLLSSQAEVSAVRVTSAQTPATGPGDQEVPPAEAVIEPLNVPGTRADRQDMPLLGVQLPSMVELNIPEARLELLFEGLNYPWAFEFISDSELLITEISGKLSRLDWSSGELIPILGIPRTSAGLEQSGLLDVALHPEFADNQRIYFSYTVSDEKTGKFHLTAVGSAILDGNQLLDVQRIFSAEPFTWSPSNFGGALAFDDQGYLFVSIGDRSEHGFAQLGGHLQGKILRLNEDGSIPPDNPFVDVSGVHDAIWAFGVRNPQGLYFDAHTSRLFETEHGPMGGDEVNIIRRGENYGWPDSSYGMNYTDIGLGEVGQVGTHAKGMQQPLWYYLPSMGISPIIVYRGDMFPEWDGDLMVGTLRGRSISKLDLDGELIRSEFRMLYEIDDRIRDIRIARDGSIFVLAQKGNIFRLHRPPTPPADPLDKGEMIYTVVCANCHETGADGAPGLASRRGWERIEQQDLNQTYQHAIEGYGLMPARGLCTICSDEHIRTAVDYMLRQVRLHDAQNDPSDAAAEAGE